VLSGADSRDDKIVRLLLETDELVPAVARFARRGGKKPSKASSIQPLSRVHVTLRGRPSDTLALLETVALETPHAIVKGDLVRFALATSMSEVVLQLVPDWGREEGVYALLARALGHLDDPGAAAGEALLALFELRMLDLAGVMPPISSLFELPAPAREALQGWQRGRFVA
jgi:DNA repair protein RecO